MKTIRAATTICAVSKIASLFLLVGCQDGLSGMSGPGFKTMVAPVFLSACAAPWA